VMVLFGDPVGPPTAFPALLRSVRRIARQRGLKLAVLGASPALAELYRELGMRTLYLGDEAVVELDTFTLQGRPIRKVRQSVARLERAGYRAELRSLDTITPVEMGEIEHVMEVGRIGDAERGYAMGMDGIRGALEQDAVFFLARDGKDRIRAMLHFVPCYGRPAVSLSMMRPERDTPNGLMDFLVAAAIEGLRARGVKEMSLNFAALTKYLRNPEGSGEHVLGWIAKRLDAHLQIESLYRANAKFLPRWDPRYLVHEARLDFPRAVIATMWIEGQLPKPELPHWNTRQGQRTIKLANR
jgi:lysyl-tRNA synthetase class 2